MDLDLSITSVALCIGCLSAGRKLNLIYSDECKQLFCEFLDNFEFLNRPLSVCFECTALLWKVLSFKRKVKNAYSYLLTYMSHRAQPASLSNLEISETETFTNFPQLNVTQTTSEMTITKRTSQHLIDKEKVKSKRKTRKKAEITLSKSNDSLRDIIQSDSLDNDFSDNDFQFIDSPLTSYKNKHVYKSQNDNITVINKKSPDKINSTSDSTLQGFTYEVKVESDKVNDDNDKVINENDIVINDNGKVRDENEKVASQNEGNMEPLTFIKIEDNEFELEETFIDDGISNKDNNKVVHTINEKTVNDDDFDESDDEPLQKKKTNKNKKNHKHKKESEDNPVPKAKSRERPPGVVSDPRVEKKLKQLNVSPSLLERVLLSWPEVEAERQKALSSLSYTRHEFRCQHCAVGFNHRFKLDTHTLKHSPDTGPLECTVCTIRFKTDSALLSHRRRHRSRWRCTACGDTYSRAGVAADHAARAHAAQPPTHTCRVCGHTAPTLGKLRVHLKNHAERQRCELCGKSFRDKASLRTHLFIHTDQKDFACAVCEKKFRFKKALEIHLITHQESQHLYCTECDMTFKNRLSYYQHVKYSLKHIDPAKIKYACTECDKRFTKPQRLEEHKLSVHLKLTPLRCTVLACTFACASRPALRTHIRMVHRNKRYIRNHVCHTCGRAYTTKKILEGHMRSHSGERPFACGQCPSTFGYEAALYNHSKLVHKASHTPRRRKAPLPPTLQNEPPANWPLPPETQPT